MVRADDRELFRLAIPAFGALVAEPLYVLADTAIVGHLGTRPLGGMGVAVTVLDTAFGVFNFLAYATTAAVARRLGAGDRRAAAEHGIAGVWLAVALGLFVTFAGLVLSGPIVGAIGASASVRAYALTYLRISLLGAPFLLVSLAGTGYLRGLQDTRTPLVIAVVANVTNLALELLLVYGWHLGIAGSAWGTVATQVAVMFAYLAIVRSSARGEGAALRVDWARVRATAVVGSHLVVRTGSLLAAFVLATSLASRTSTVAVAAHQVAFHVWLFLALALDALAIAGQSMVGKALGSHDVAGTRRATRRMLVWGVRAGLVLGGATIAAGPLLALVFSRDQAVRHLVGQTLLIVGAMQPLCAVVFVLDGVLIGAGDSRYLAGAMAAATAIYAPLALGIHAMGGGLLALWTALVVFLAARAVGMGARYRGDRWLVVGAVRA